VVEGEYKKSGKKTEKCTVGWRVSPRRISNNRGEEEKEKSSFWNARPVRKGNKTWNGKRIFWISEIRGTNKTQKKKNLRKGTGKGRAKGQGGVGQKKEWLGEKETLPEKRSPWHENQGYSVGKDQVGRGELSKAKQKKRGKRETVNVFMD